MTNEEFMQYVETNAEAIAAILRNYLGTTTAGPQATSGQVKLDHAPRAEEREPGQWWVEIGHAYTLAYDDKAKLALKIWKRAKDGEDYLEFPVAWVRELDPGWPGTWIDKMESNGLRQEFKQPVYLVMQVAGRKNNKGNYYVNCQKMTTKREEAGL